MAETRKDSKMSLSGDGMIKRVANRDVLLTRMITYPWADLSVWCRRSTEEITSAYVVLLHMMTEYQPYRLADEDRVDEDGVDIGSLAALREITSGPLLGYAQRLLAAYEVEYTLRALESEIDERVAQTKRMVQSGLISRTTGKVIKMYESGVPAVRDLEDLSSRTDQSASMESHSAGGNFVDAVEKVEKGPKVTANGATAEGTGSVHSEHSTGKKSANTSKVSELNLYNYLRISCSRATVSGSCKFLPSRRYWHQSLSEGRDPGYIDWKE